MFRNLTLLTLASFALGPSCDRQIQPSSPCCVEENYQKKEATLSPASLFAKIEREMGKGRARMAEINAAKASEELIQCVETVPCAPLEPAELILRAKKGAIQIRGGSSQVCESTLNYLEADVPPKITYCFYDGIQHVEVLALQNHTLWEINLGATNPIGVQIDAQGGVRDLNFRNVLLSSLNVEAQSGVSFLGVMGGQPYLQHVECNQAYGSIALNAEGDYPSMKSVSISTGCGDISGIFTGYYARLDEMHLSTTGGDMALDLTGAWKRTCRIRLNVTDGNCLLYIPRGVGTSIRVNKSRFGTVDMGGMNKKWALDGYVNEAYGKTKAFLDIEIEATDGNIQIVQFGA